MSKIGRIIVVLGCIVVVAVIAMTYRPHSAEHEASISGRYNLVLISLDSLRSDRLGTYGYTRDTSPALDEFAKQSVVFDSAISVSSWTLPSHMTLFTGLYPSSHGVVNKTKQPSKDTKLLAEILKEQGYRTFGFTGGGNVAKRFGFARGFEIYEQKEEEDKATGIKGFRVSIDKAMKTLDSLKKDERYFLFLHTYDVHCPYNPPEPYYSMFNTPGAEPLDTGHCGEHFMKNGAPRQAEVTYISDRYDGGIRWVDDQLKVFLSFLKQRGDLDHTVVVITSDHGEEFLEHGNIGHQFSLYRELLEIPLIVYVPGVPPKRVSTSVSLVDVTPSVTSFLGVESAPGLQGRSFQYLLGGSVEETPIRDFQYSELHRGAKLKSRFGERSHLIVRQNTGEKQLFDLKEDPREQRNLAMQDVARTDLKAKQLSSFIDSLSSEARPTGNAPRPKREEAEKLKTLGYMM